MSAAGYFDLAIFDAILAGRFAAAPLKVLMLFARQPAPNVVALKVWRVEDVALRSGISYLQAAAALRRLHRRKVLSLVPSGASFLVAIKDPSSWAVRGEVSHERG